MIEVKPATDRTWDRKAKVWHESPGDGYTATCGKVEAWDPSPIAALALACEMWGRVEGIGAIKGVLCMGGTR